VLYYVWVWRLDFRLISLLFAERNYVSQRNYEDYEDYEAYAEGHKSTHNFSPVQGYIIVRKISKKSGNLLNESSQTMNIARWCADIDNPNLIVFVGLKTPIPAINLDYLFGPWA
jgi:hypothetical protein